MSLWQALWTGFGWPYISLGLLKLFSDALNFAGSNDTSCPLPADLLSPALLHWPFVKEKPWADSTCKLQVLQVDADLRLLVLHSCGGKHRPI